jgi:hypothetical protein
VSSMLWSKTKNPQLSGRTISDSACRQTSIIVEPYW